MRTLRICTADTTQLCELHLGFQSLEFQFTANSILRNTFKTCAHLNLTPNYHYRENTNNHFFKAPAGNLTLEMLSRLERYQADTTPIPSHNAFIPCFPPNYRKIPHCSYTLSESICFPFFLNVTCKTSQRNQRTYPRIHKTPIAIFACKCTSQEMILKKRDYLIRERRRQTSV